MSLAVVFVLLGSGGGDSLTAGWPIVWCAGAESSEWTALAPWSLLSIWSKVGQICSALGSKAGQGDAPPTIALLHFLQVAKEMRFQELL